MPIICRFNGIIIKMYFRQSEHNPPHIHAIFGEYVGVFLIIDGSMLEGDIPIKQQRMIRKFIHHYRDRLMQMWELQDFEVLPVIGSGD